MPLDDMIRDLTKKSDIPYGSELYQDVSRKLIDMGLNLSFFTFLTSENSSCAQASNTGALSCPVLTIYLRFNVDFRQTGINPHNGNWDGKWSQTRTVRDALNGILHGYGLDKNYVSEYTFVFVRALEELAFQLICQECASSIRDLVMFHAPGVRVDGVYWNGEECYILLRDKTDYNRVKRKKKDAVIEAIPKLLAKADKDEYCQNYKTTVQFGYGGVVPMHFLRGG